MKKIIVLLLLSFMLISCRTKDIQDSTAIQDSQKNSSQTQKTSTQALSVPAVAPGTVVGTGAAFDISKANEKILSGDATITPQDEVKVATQLPQIDPLKLGPPAMTQKEKSVVLKIGKNEFQTLKNKIVTLDNIVNGTKFSSKVHLSGKVPTNWIFEGTFPIKIYDIGGGVLGEGVGKANIFDKNGKVIESSVVEFQADLDLVIPALAKKGYLKLFADNPSGMAQNDDNVSIKIVF